MTTTRPGFRIHPIPADAFRAARADGLAARVTAAAAKRCAAV